MKFDTTQNVKQEAHKVKKGKQTREKLQQKKINLNTQY